MRQFLKTVTRLDVTRISLNLFGIGAAGFVGTLLIGFVLKKSLIVAMIGIPLGLGLVAACLIAAGHSRSSPGSRCLCGERK